MIHKHPSAWQAVGLVVLDNITNLLDYLFHIYLARVLQPGDFVMVQAINGVMVLLVTLFAVMQPVVARYVAEGRYAAPTTHYLPHSGVIRYYFMWSVGVGITLGLLAWLAARPISVWLRVPVTAVYWSVAMLFLAVVRPVVAGGLQGQERFVVMGLVRLVYALGRFALAGLLLFWGLGAMGVIAAMPLSSLLALCLGLFCLGWSVWQPGPPLPAHFRRGFALSLAAFMAFAAYMCLQTYDLLWVNRVFVSTTAGQYASAVLLRRIVLLLSSAVLLLLYPQIIAQVQLGKTPDKLLAKAAVLVVAPALLLTGVYFLGGEWISQLTFAGAYTLNGRFLGWMGLAMVGYGVVSVWLNLFLATHPWPFVGLLLGTAVLQIVCLSFQSSLWGITAVFTLTGWLAALGGLLLYLLWLRPMLSSHEPVHHK